MVVERQLEPVVGDVIALKAGVWPSLLSNLACRRGLPWNLPAKLETNCEGPRGNPARDHLVRDGFLLDGFTSRLGLYHARKHSDVAWFVLHENVRTGMASDHRIRPELACD